MVSAKARNTIRALNQTLLMGISLDERCYSLLPTLRQASVQTRAAREFFPGMEMEGVSIATNFDVVGTCSVFAPQTATSSELATIRAGEIKYVCSFWPTGWLDDLYSVGVRPFNIDYLMYQSLNNKLTQAEILSTKGTELIRRQNKKRRDLLRTELSIPDHLDFFRLENARSEFVIAAQTSAGGSGIYRINSYFSLKHALSNLPTPVVRIETFGPSISFTHFGVVFGASVATLPPQIQAIQEINHQLRYVGASFGVEHALPEQAVDSLHRQCPFFASGDTFD